jgi:hypothetical protein
MKRCLIKRISILILLFSFSICTSYSQDNVAIANADTSNFSVNIGGGWQLFNSYVSTLSVDSVLLEIIVQHTNSIDLSVEQYVGKIKILAMRPALSQTLFFNLIAAYYSLRIDQGGKCYLKFLTGARPASNPFVIPVRVVYKR